jgi:hypothetical protein
VRGLVLKLIRRRRLERDLETELAFHEDMSRADGNEIRLGNRVRVKEQARDVWRWWLVEELWRNLRHGARQLVRSAAFSSAAVLTLGLAVGATAAIFTLVHRVVLNPLPYSRSDRLVQLDHGSLAFNVPTGLGMKAGLYQYYSERATTLEAVAIYTTGAATLAGRGEPERVRVTRATPTLSAVLGVEPELGRWLTEAEGVPGAPSTAVISHGLWSRRYGNATDVIGRTLNLDGVATTIVGVMSAG